jgi:hypothetical protein
MEVIPIKMRVVDLIEMFLQGREARCEGAGVQDTDAFAFEKSLEVIFWVKLAVTRLRKIVCVMCRK